MPNHCKYMNNLCIAGCRMYLEIFQLLSLLCMPKMIRLRENCCGMIFEVLVGAFRNHGYYVVTLTMF